MITGFIAGLCGADVSPEMLEEMAIETLNKNKPEPGPIWVKSGR